MKKIITIIALYFIIIFFFPNSLFSRWEKIEIKDTNFVNTFWLDIFFLNSNPNYGWICGMDGSIIRTTDGGNTWSGTKIKKMKIDTIYKHGKIYRYDTSYVSAVNQLESIQFVDTLVGYTSGENMAFKSTDGGKNWEKISKNNMSIWGLYFPNKDTGMVIGGGCVDFQEFYRTENGGNNWTVFEANEKLSALSDLILYSADGLGYASSSGLIWKTSDGGKTWAIFSETGDKDWQEDLAIGNHSFLVPYAKGCWGGANSGGLRMSIDNGLHWIDFDTKNEMFGTFLLDSLHGWGCGINNSIYYTTNGGNTWILENDGTDSLASFDDIWFVNDTLGFVAGSGIYRTNFTSINVNDNFNRNKNLSFNASAYPNPFDNTTTITFDLKESMIMTITVSDIYGRELNRIISNKYLDSGKHNIQFNNKNLLSGIYFCRLISNNYSETIKLIIIK